MNNIKILIVEDQKLMRIGIESLFNDYKEMEIIGQAENGKEAIEKAKLNKPDIILMDIGLPDISGIDQVFIAATHYIDVQLSELFHICSWICFSADPQSSVHFVFCGKAVVKSTVFIKAELVVFFSGDQIFIIAVSKDLQTVYI